MVGICWILNPKFDLGKMKNIRCKPCEDGLGILPPALPSRVLFQEFNFDGIFFVLLFLMASLSLNRYPSVLLGFGVFLVFLLRILYKIRRKRCFVWWDFLITGANSFLSRISGVLLPLKLVVPF